METLRFIGNCQGCGVDHKLHRDLLVHHGYQRPGHGEIVGDCAAVGHPPYELSCEWTKLRLAYLEDALVRRRARLAELPSATVLEVLPAFFYPGAETVTYLLCVTEPARWNQALGRVTRDVEFEITTIEREIVHRKARIAGWTLRPVREVNEESIQAEQRAATAKRVEERRAARDAKEAKAAAYKAKQAARAAERQGVLDGFVAQLRALALLPEGHDRTTKVRALCRDIEKRKHQRFGRWSPHDLDCGDVLVTLGLATRDGEYPNGKPFYRYTINTPW